MLPSLFFLHSHRAPRTLHSFPTRRSSDLQAFVAAARSRTSSSITALDPATADLHYRGFSRLYRKGGRYGPEWAVDRKSTRLNSSHITISYAVFCLKKKKSTEWL